MRSWESATPKETAAQVVLWLPALMDCPCDQNLLERALSPAENHLLMDEGEAIAWLALIEGECGWTLDVATKRKGKWLTRSVIDQAYEIIFKDREFVILENSKGAALKFALHMGANPIMIPGKKDTYLLSRMSFKGRLN